MRAESRMKKLEIGKWVREDGGRWRTLESRIHRGEVYVARFGLHRVNMKSVLYMHDQYPFATLSLPYA